MSLLSGSAAAALDAPWSEGSAETPVASPLAQVESLMVRLCAGDRLERCGAMVVEHLRSGGKRLRAQLALEAGRALGAPASDAVAWAAACELLHNASLVHDDLQDGDRQRRGHATTWVRYGAGQAINVGDLLLMVATLALDEVSSPDALKWRLSRALSACSAETVRGQSMEMSLLSSRALDVGDYERAVQGKTGAFFALPVHGAALLAGRSEETARALADEFLRLGLLFQMQDDVLDLYGDKGRGERGADVREGKVTTLVTRHLKLRPEDHDWMVAILEAPRERCGDALVADVARSFRDSGALEDVMEHLYALSRDLINSPVLAAEPELHAVAVKLLERVLAPLRRLDASLPLAVVKVGGVE
jgi:geranylgeranyl diphosphate synthase type I